MELRIKARVTGKVQGVWYRKSTMEQAKTIGVTGFVRNERDGSVYFEAQGSQQQLSDLVSWSRLGPDEAVVTDVEYESIPVIAESDFIIVY